MGAEDYLAESRKLRSTDPSAALKASLMARQIAEAVNNLKSTADSLLESGYCLSELSNFDESATAFSQAAEVYHEIMDTAGEAEAVNELGVCWGEKGENSKALEFLMRSLSLWQRIDQPGGLARCLSSIGNRYYYYSQYDTAFEYYQKSFELRERIQDFRGMAVCYNNQALVFDKIGDCDRSAEFYHKAIDLYEQVGAKTDLANCLMNLAALQNQCLGKHEDARQSLERALSLVKGVNKLVEALCYHELGNVARSLREYNRAEEYYQAGLTMLEETGSHHIMAELLLDRARSRLAARKSAGALACLEQALMLATPSTENEVVFLAHQYSSEAYEQLGDYSAALSHFKKFHKVREEVLNAQTELKVKGLAIKAETEKARNEAEIYRLKNEELSRTHSELRLALAQNKILYDELQLRAEDLMKQVWEDSLTGVHNRRFLEQRLADESERAMRFSHDLTLVIMDIDNFKVINDRFSHPVGDQVLKVVARLLTETCRSVDMVGRYGGDEFMLLLIETSADQAQPICERIRLAVSGYEWERIHAGLEVTISIGLCSQKSLPRGVTLVDCADQHLYEAKRLGRNQVVGFSPN